MCEHLALLGSGILQRRGARALVGGGVEVILGRFGEDVVGEAAGFGTGAEFEGFGKTDVKRYQKMIILRTTLAPTRPVAVSPNRWGVED